MNDETIERVARLMCTSLGFEPDEMVQCGPHDDMTPQEINETGGVVQGYLTTEPRWRLMRREAAIAIAAKIATKDI